MSQLHAYVVLVVIVLVAGFGGGTGFAYLYSRKVLPRIEAAIRLLERLAS